MRLKKLIIHGFKSFADRAEISFDGGITGVVGPNGCGKSNIADAVRWVLGEQSAKTLRGTKMEDVIFNGTERRRRLAFCEVSLVFDNEDKALPIDFAEVSVTRRVYRSGEGEYKINGAQCRLRDIIDLFRDTGVGKDGYSLIGQGRIDEILSQKSEDRRQVFEEAAGIVKYKARKLEAQRRMEHTRDNLSRVEDILTELNDRVEPLRVQSEEAREYLALRDELKSLDLNVFLVRSKRNEERILELNQSIDSLAQALNEGNEHIAELSERREEIQTELDAKEADTAETRDEVQQLIRDVEAREGSVNVLKERIQSYERDQARIQSEREAALSGQEGIAERIARMEAMIQGETREVEIARVVQSEAEAALAASENELMSLEEQSEREKQRIIQAMNRLGDVRSQKARLSAMKTAIEDRLSVMAQDRTREQAGASALGEQVAEAQEVVRQEREQQREIQRKIDAVAQQLAQANERGQALSARLAEQIAQREQRSSRLKLLKEMQRDYEGYNNSVKQVLLQARRTPNSGVHGVVADIIRVPERLERALDMVLGASLQNVVVDRDEDAKRMIEYLRKNRFGRATFLPIQSVRGRTLNLQERKVLDMPGCVGLASELIGFDAQYAPVIENLLGRTVVAEDLNSGIAIQRAGHYQFRLVTLEGDVMHSGGSMTGGSVQSRMTSLLSRSREIQETEEALRSIEAELGQLRAQTTAEEQTRADYKKQRNEWYDALHRQEVLSARAETQLQAVLEEQKGNQARADRSEQERVRLAHQLEEIESSLKRLSEQQQSEEDSHTVRQEEVQKLQEKIYALRTLLESKRTDTAEARIALVRREKSLEAKIEE
ncbi:MAG: chromosome segregation protein SMC, partial [Clostridia bacterium]|nr:chromosome segregation protein SMC [Clostridia bacterium]